MSNYQPLDKSKHHELKIKQIHPCVLAKEKGVIPIGLRETVTACAEYPVVFVKDESTGQFRLVVLVGLRPNQSLFYSSDGWLGKHIPKSARSSPIALTQIASDEHSLIVCVDTDSKMLSKVDGRSLFDDNGAQSDFLNELIADAEDLYADHQLVKPFCDLLLEQNLLSPFSLNVEAEDGSNLELKGLYSIDEAKLNQLDKDMLIKLRDQGALPFVYAMLFSMARIDSLLKRYNEQSR